MKLLYVIFLILICSSCTRSKKENISLAGKAYSFAPELDTSNCTVTGACDCCTSDLWFRDKRNFILIDYCMADETVLTGSYEMRNDSVFLKYQMAVNRTSNWEEAAASNVDSFKETYTIQVEKFEPEVLGLSVFYCKDNFCMQSGGDGLGYGVPHKSMSAAQVRKKLEDEGLWQKLELR